jgi:hypothetical protein
MAPTRNHMCHSQWFGQLVAIDYSNQLHQWAAILPTTIRALNRLLQEEPKYLDEVEEKVG